MSTTSMFLWYILKDLGYKLNLKLKSISTYINFFLSNTTLDQHIAET